ncbi:MAG: lytic transglycosylase domain-containing protein [Treponema sp.]|nr:lytic transglycosylase domain-containing protein [Treponema sp.]
MRRRKAALLSALASLFLVMSASCGRKKQEQENTQEKYGRGTEYFMGLRSLQMGEEAKGKRQLRSASKCENPLIARKAKEELANGEDGIDTRIKAMTALFNEYQDEEALLPLVRELYENREYAKIISVTEGVDLTSCHNSIAYYRLSSMNEKHDSRFSREFLSWCTERPFDRLQYSLYSELTAAPKVVRMLALLYTRNYGSTLPLVKEFMEGGGNMTAQIASGIGRCLLYGSAESAENASYLEKYAATAPAGCQFYFYFYAARLYDRAKGKYDSASECYKAALATAKDKDGKADEKLYDNALWYYLQSAMELSPEAAVKALERYRDKWHDPYYFDDFLDTLSYRLLSGQFWGLYVRTADLLKGFASLEACAKFSYVSARLLQDGIYRPKDMDADGEAMLLLNSALDSGTDLYYRMLAASRLSVGRAELEERLRLMRQDKDFERNVDAEELLLGYADFGFPEKIYDEWQSHKDEIGLDTVRKLSSFLFSCGKNQEGYYTQSLRIASRKLHNSEAPLSGLDDNLFSLSFPRAFSSKVSEYCAEYGLDEDLMYALIRSESFFDPSVISSAGAVGLTQLMEMTAGDVAKKLKVSKYDLTDSGTNVQFGSYYISELIRRLDGSQILALFAYNAGITRVRGWSISVSDQYKEKNQALANDLFLEMLPISETREYGRKIVGAASVYGLLYYDLDPDEVVSRIMGAVSKSPR